MSSGHGTTRLTINSPDKNDFVELEVSYSWWYDAGVRYHADGTGTPPDGGVEVTDFETVGGEPPPLWLTDEMVDDALNEADLDYN
jgi:hypothetical protein